MQLNFFARWRAARDASHQLDLLLAQADANAALASRNEWLMELGYWLRKPVPSSADGVPSFAEHTRLRLLLRVLDRNPEQASRFAACLRSILRDNDARSLFADTGMAARPGLSGELVARVQTKLLPVAPNRAELADVFALLFISERDAEWVAALDEAVISRLAEMLDGGGGAESVCTTLGAALSDSIALLCSQIAAAALEAPIRMRLDAPQESARVLMQLPRLAHELIQTEAASEQRVHLLNQLRAALARSRTAVNSVYDHLERFGVSVDVVFQVERTRLRIERVEQLLAVWTGQDGMTAHTALVAQLIVANQQRSSVRALLGETYQLLGRKVVERSAETGEHYIARTRRDYFGMWRMAAGGGLLTAGTVYLKFFIAALHLNKFVEGVLFSLDYVGSFLAIHFAHFTLATKQPAMTAPALAQKLDDVNRPEGRTAFVEETIALIRSQMAAISGNLAIVFPVALGAQLLVLHTFNTNLLTNEKAEATIQSFSLADPHLRSIHRRIALGVQPHCRLGRQLVCTTSAARCAGVPTSPQVGIRCRPCPSHRRFRQKARCRRGGQCFSWFDAGTGANRSRVCRHPAGRAARYAEYRFRRSVGRCAGLRHHAYRPILVGGGWYCINGRA